MCRKNELKKMKKITHELNIPFKSRDELLEFAKNHLPKRFAVVWAGGFYGSRQIYNKNFQCAGQIKIDRTDYQAQDKRSPKARKKNLI
jgi:hypothetical protein